MQLIAELKRRKVFRVAAAYAVSAWALAQVADLVLENTAAPPWVMQVILLVLALGFPLAVLLAWAFEVTPGGVKRTEALESGEKPPALAAQDRLLIALLLGVIVIVGYQVAAMPGKQATPSNPSAAESQPRPNEITTPEQADGSTSIAVLAFENMSPDPDNAFFAEGISEEILNVLASVENLRVASRTSAFSFAGTQTAIPDIADRLGVVHVLEGSVRKAGNRVRITAQLIDAETDQHLWSDTYDRDLDDIFAVQEEIAQAITLALKNELGIREIRVEAVTENLEAYELMLRGRQRFHQRGSALNDAIADLERAVELDPGFGLAWAVLAATYHVAPGYPASVTVNVPETAASRALDRALAIDPEQPLALAVQGQIQINENDWITGLETLARAADIATQETTPALWLALNLYAAGYVSEAKIAIDKAWSADPLVGVTNGYRGIIDLSLGNEQFDQSMAFAADTGWLQSYVTLALERLAAGQIEQGTEALTTFIRYANRDGDRPLMTLAGPVQPGPIREVTLSLRDSIMSMLNDTDSYYERWLAVDGGLLFWLRNIWLPSTDVLREHPLMFEIARRRGLVELWEHRGYPPGCKPVEGPDGRHLDCAEFPG